MVLRIVLGSQSQRTTDPGEAGVREIQHPAAVFHRISLFAMDHVAFAVTIAGSASEAKSFEATSRSLALRPGDSPPPLRWDEVLGSANIVDARTN